MEIKNYGVIIEQKISDWVSGVTSQIIYRIVLACGDWLKYLPTKEKQLINNLFETFACVTFSALNVIETTIDMMVAMAMIPADQLKKLQDWGYFDSEGHFNASDAFIAILSGTQYKYDVNKPFGNSASKVWDTINKYGLVPQSMLDRSNAKTADEWYATIPQEVIDFGKNFFVVFNKIQYEQIKSGDCGPADLSLLQYHLKQSPLQMLAHCAQNNTDEFFKNTDCEAQHATAIFSAADYIGQFDTYGNFINKLDKNYVIPYIIKAVVTLKQPGTIEQQKIAILKLMIQIYTQWISMLQNKAGAIVGAIKNTFKK